MSEEYDDFKLSYDIDKSRSLLELMVLKVKVDTMDVPYFEKASYMRLIDRRMKYLNYEAYVPIARLQ
jgi:hypothetical protein|tara:strand:+ start:8142 stop:8342 length:201 start_codon:yes stop_codon:yes gene_type:complete